MSVWFEAGLAHPDMRLGLPVRSDIEAGFGQRGAPGPFREAMGNRYSRQEGRPMDVQHGSALDRAG